MLVEKRYVSKALFNGLVDKIKKVFATFNPKDFPTETRNRIVMLKEFLDEKFLREAVILGSEE